ncbi:hypothetical protein OD350_28555 (plasmid) [Clostridium beijerinckii]|uniref:hypothetical protein n=1 Tax=Clostridium beijerinckii TaxID=1520 RepID=UPI0022270E9A|nr:hypothetical protein [Clostridium beijerinckii]UYZ39025.1 hypothetical protein OD350_28555 [Clostridium beijerinckii]
MKEYQSIFINKDIVCRKEDKALFSLKNMEIYQFTEDGFKLIDFLYNSCEDNKIEYRKFIKLYLQNNEINESEIDEFLDKLSNKNIISIC